MSEREATKRAIESITAGLREGPRDGTERLRALRRRILDKQAAREAEPREPRVGTDAEATARSPTEITDSRNNKTKRGRPE